MRKNLHKHHYVGSALFQAARIWSPDLMPDLEPELYVAAEGWVCHKCGKPKIKYINVFGFPCKREEIPAPVADQVDKWLRNEPIPDLLRFGKRKIKP